MKESNKKEVKLTQKCNHRVFQILLFAFLSVVDGIFLSFLPHINATSRAFPTKAESLSETSLNMNLRAWTCHGRSQREMVDRLASVSFIIVLI